MKSIARNLSVSRAFPIFVGVFFCSYLFFSVLMPSNSNINISAKTPAQYKILAEIFGTPAEAGHSWISTRLNTDFSCPAGSTGVTYQNNPPDVGVANDQAQWFACYASPTALAGLYPSAPLLQQYFGPGWSGAGCESGSVPHVYNNYVGNDYDAIWVACSSPTPVPVVPTPPPVPTISQAQCTGTSITTAFSSVGASWYAVRLADLTSGSLISNGICDPASNSNETCQWQTGTSLNRTGIAGHTYRMWVHGATNTSWSSGTYSAAAYATDFSCPPPAVPVPPAPPAFTTSCPVPGTSMTSTSFYTPGATYYNLRVDSQSTSFTPSFINDPSCSSVNSGDTCINNYTGTSYSGSTTPTYYYDVWVHACNASGCSPSATHNQYSRCFTVCSDNADNDGDGLTDMSDPGCSSPADNDEYNAPLAFSCTGTTPANANICANDDSGLTANTGRTLVSSCTSGTKCEYVCSTGYVYSGGTCVLAGGGGGVPAPTVTLNANPTALAFGGGTTTLSWNTTNAASCMASGGWSGSKSTANGFTASQTSPSFSGTTTFTLQCWNSDNSASDTKSVTVTVAAGGGSFISPPAGYCVASPSPPNYADCSTWAKPTGLNPASYAIVNHGAKNMTFCQESVVVPGTWITNSTQCYGSGCWSGSSPQTSSGQYEVGTNYVAGTYQTYRCNVSTNIAEKNEGSGWSSVTWGSSGQPIRCVEVNTCSGSLTDLMGTMMSVTPLVPGNVTFTGMVANVSSVNATAPFDNVFQLDMNNNGSYSDLGDVTLTTPTFPFVLTGGGGAGSSAARSATYNMSAGNYNVRFFVDSGSVVPESNEANNYSASFPFTVGGAPSGPATAALEVVCTPITCGSVPEVVNYCTNETFSVSNPCGGFITCSGTKSCSNSDANWREVAP